MGNISLFILHWYASKYTEDMDSPENKVRESESNGSLSCSHFKGLFLGNIFRHTDLMGYVYIYIYIHKYVYIYIYILSEWDIIWMNSRDLTATSQEWLETALFRRNGYN